VRRHRNDLPIALPSWDPNRNQLYRKPKQGFFSIFHLENIHNPRIIELMQKYADLPMDLADASLVILAEHLGHGRIFSVDQRDFNTYRWKECHPFTNLLIS